jgi:hypothetical protein
MEAQLTDIKCVDGTSEAVFDNPNNLKKVDDRFASVPSSPSKGGGQPLDGLSPAKGASGLRKQ